MRRILLTALAALLTLVPLRADALTVRDVIELTRAGVGEDVLLALIEVDPSVFPIDTATLKRLKDAGVSERVIVAMVRSGRTQPPLAVADAGPVEEVPAAPAPQVVVIDHQERQPVREVAVPVPVYIPVPVRSTHRPIDSGIYDQGHRPTEPVKRAEPVYWGWGGKPRPDAWQPTPAETPVKKKPQ